MLSTATTIPSGFEIPITHSDPAFRYWALVGLGKTAASAAAAKDAI